MSGWIISLFCLKGGVGKTTVSILLAQSLASLGQSVLVIDLDETPMASEALIGREEFAKLREDKCVDYLLASYAKGNPDNLYEFIQKDFADFFIGNPNKPNLSLLPGSENLGEIEDVLCDYFIRLNRVSANKSAHIKLSTAASDMIKDCAQCFDDVIIDCPPRPSDFCSGATKTSDLILVPYIPDHVAFGRIQQTARMVEHVSSDEQLKQIDHGKRRYILLPNQVDSRMNSPHKSIIDGMRRNDHPHAFIYDNIRQKENFEIKNDIRLTRALNWARYQDLDTNNRRLTLPQIYGNNRVLDGLANVVDTYFNERSKSEQ